MRIPLKSGIDIGPCHRPPVCQESKGTQAGQTNDKGVKSFDRLLKDTSRDITAGSHLCPSTLPMEGEMLRQLADIVQTEMNRYLFRALNKPDEADNYSGSGLDWMNFPTIGSQLEELVSKIQHAYSERAGIESQYDIDNIIDHASQTHGVDPELTRAVIRAESDFDAGCTSPKGAMGLMQLMPETAKELGVKNPYNPVENVMGGTRYLRDLLDRYDGNVNLALAAYNWGMGNLERHPKSLPAETRTYITRVNQYYREATA